MQTSSSKTDYFPVKEIKNKHFYFTSNTNILEAKMIFIENSKTILFEESKKTDYIIENSKTILFQESKKNNYIIQAKMEYSGTKHFVFLEKKKKNLIIKAKIKYCGNTYTFMYR